MKMQRNPLMAAFVIALIIAGSLLLWSAGAGSQNRTASTSPIATEATVTTSDEPITLTPPPSTCHYCSGSLVGKSHAEVAQFAQELARQQLKANGPVQVLVTRAVNDQELANLGLGCGPSFAAIEQAPLVLTILKGEFDFRGAAPGFDRLPPPIPGKPVYAVYVFDAWAGSPVVIMPSEDGALVKKALQDSTLPDSDQFEVPSQCATTVPASEKLLHYGDVAPGFVVPPQAPLETTPVPLDTPVPPRTAQPVGTGTPPQPTVWVPTPIPTVSSMLSSVEAKSQP